MNIIVPHFVSCTHKTELITHIEHLLRLFVVQKKNIRTVLHCYSRLANFCFTRDIFWRHHTKYQYAHNLRLNCVVYWIKLRLGDKEKYFSSTMQADFHSLRSKIKVFLAFFSWFTRKIVYHIFLFLEYSWFGFCGNMIGSNCNSIYILVATMVDTKKGASLHFYVHSFGSHHYCRRILIRLERNHLRGKVCIWLSLKLIN